MAKTLLNGTNEVLKALGVIQGDSGLLTTLSDSARQTHIDLVVQKWNEAVGQLYRVCNRPKPDALAENTITLATDDRDYALQADLVEMIFPLQDETNGSYLFEWTRGYLDMVARQPQPANYTGLAQYAVIRPTDGELYLDRIPTSVENTRVYKYRYKKSLLLSAAADTMPFTDETFTAMVPVVTQLYRRERESGGDDPYLTSSFAMAARALTQIKARSHW